ncbi:MAG: glycosyltransferase family 4 protein [Promethearchaeota archaeon]
MSVNKERKIKVCFVSMLGYPLYNKQCKRKLFGGGAAVQLYLLSKELSKNSNFEINVITGNYQLTENKVEIADNIKIYNIRPIQRKFSYYFFSLINLFIILMKIKPDVIIQRGADKVSGVCAFYCKLFNKKFLFSIANLTDVNGKSERGFLGRFFKYGINNANHIIAQNKDQILVLEKYKNKRFNNITVIKSSYEIKEPIIKDKKEILWVGRAIDWKRPELFFKLAEKFPNEQFIMICNKTDNKIESIKYWNTINAEASKISNLKFLEFVPFHEINQFFEKAKVIVNTSIYEGFPNTFIQAFRNKKPIISLNVNPDDLLTKNKLGFWCNNNFDEMVKNLKKLLENEELYNIYSQNCINYAREHHDVKKNVKQWIKIIMENNNSN